MNVAVTDVRQGHWSWPPTTLPLVAVVVAASLWISSLSAIDPGQMTDLGLLSVLPVRFYAGLGLLLISACAVIYYGRAHPALFTLHVVVLIGMIHGTPAWVYGTLRYSWAWKHVGIVDYIQRHGAVDPAISVLPAYHNWPGFFALSALLTEGAGFENPLAYASWAPVIFNLLNLGALTLLLRSLTRDRRLIALATLLFFVTNWVGQDYFAPQALGYFLHLVILAICTTWLRAAQPPSLHTIRRLLLWRRLAAAVHAVLHRAAATEPGDRAAKGPMARGWAILVLLLFAAVVTSHQLTPVMTIITVTGLVLVRRCRDWLLPILMVALFIGWLATGAGTFMTDGLASLIASIGQVTDHVNSSLRDASRFSAGQVIVSLVVRALTLAVWTLAFLGAIRRWRAGKRDLSAWVLGAAPFVPLVGDSYGGEILFRTFLFSLPAAAFFVAALIYPRSRQGRTKGAAVASALLSGLLLTGFLFSYYGKDRQYYFTSQEAAATVYVATHAPPGTLLVEGSRNYPSQFKNYENFIYVPIAREPADSQARVVADPVGTFVRWMSDARYNDAYIILTRGQKIDTESLGSLPPGALSNIERALRHSPRFRVVFANDDAVVFVLASDKQGSGQREVSAQ